MPSSPDYAAIAAALSSRERAMLKESCRLLGVPLESWQDVFPLRLLFTALAVQRRAEDHQDVERIGWDRALARAAAELGVNALSHARQVRRWKAAAQSGHNVRDTSPATGG